MLDESDVSAASGSLAEHANGSRRRARPQSSCPVCPAGTKTVRLQDIADHAQVSRATVSLALRNDLSIPPATRARIQAIADRLHYRPNPLVSALMTYQRLGKGVRKTHLTLAMVLPFSRRGPNRSQVPETLLQAAAARAQEHGYRLEEFWLDDLRLSGPRLEEVLYARGIPGVLVTPFAPGLSELRLDWARFSAVVVGHALPHLRLHRVGANGLDGIRRAMMRLRQAGYQRIGLALPASENVRVDGHWSAGFLSEQHSLAAAQRVPLLVSPDEHWTERTFGRWYAARRPDVVISSDPAAREWLEKLGRRIPEETGFVQLRVEASGGDCAGIDLNPVGTGTAAVDLLVELIRRNERGLADSPQTVLLETRWVDGGTIQPELTRAWAVPAPTARVPRF